MGWSYNSDPSASNLDVVRFLSGQTSTSDDVLLQDEEINWLISSKPNNFHAAAGACDMLAARYSATQPRGESYGKTRLDWSDRVVDLRKTAKSLRAQAGLEGVSPFVGGRSISDKRSVQNDTDRVKPAFTIGMTDHPGTKQGSTVSS